MSSEHVLARRDTLQAMGLTLYAARYPLPGAAASPALFDAVIADAQPDQAPAPTRDVPARPRASDGSAGTLAGTPVVPAVDAEADDAAPPAPAVMAPPALAPFTLAAVALGGCLWLEELPDAVLGRDQVKLMRAICVALGWPVAPIAVNQFAWPMHQNPQFDQGAEAALAALSAFIQRQLEAGDCSRLILLGQPAWDRLGELSLGVPALCTPATRDMLRDPLLKRDAWRTLCRQR